MQTAPDSIIMFYQSQSQFRWDRLFHPTSKEECRVSKFCPIVHHEHVKST